MTSDSKKKKKIISILLLLSCAISFFLLQYVPVDGKQYLNDLEQVDTLIHEELAGYQISEHQITTQTVQVDTHFTRKKFYVTVPPGFSKTHLHAELSRTFDRYNLSLPARVYLPQQDMLIHFTFRNTVIRSIFLQTDPELEMVRYPASVLVKFDGKPSTKLLEEVTALGETIMVVVEVQNPVEANELQRQLIDNYPYISFMLVDEDGYNILRKQNLRSLLPSLQHLSEINPDADIVSYRNLSNDISEDFTKTMTKTGLNLIDASKAIILHEDMGKNLFMNELTNFERNARNRQHPLAIIQASTNSLNWLKEELSRLKKRGMLLTLPPKTSF